MLSRLEHFEYMWHLLHLDDIFSILHTAIDGIDDAEAQSRIVDIGLNELPAEKKPSPFIIILHQFKSPLIYILLISAAIALIAGDFIDSMVIYAALILNAVIGFYQEYSVAKSMLALKSLLSLNAVVIRGGLEREIPAEQIVPGDIVLLKPGQKVPADIRLFQVKELMIDESTLTGESSPVFKNSDPMREDSPSFPLFNMALMGTIVTAGRGKGVVVSTGPRTQLGQLSVEVRESAATKTPLQFRIEVLSSYIIIATLLFATIGFTVGLLRGERIFDLFIAMVAMAVAVVPEGLPVILTIAFAASVGRMAKNNVIIRHLPAIETIGSSTIIGSDKTGTLTKNEMTVRRIWSGSVLYRVKGDGYNPEGSINYDSSSVNATDNPALEWTLRVGLLSNESNLLFEKGRWIARGDPTEVALIVSALRGKLNEEKNVFDYPTLDLLTFESKYQYMATLHNGITINYLLVKGAPETLFSLSDSMLNSSGVKIAANNIDLNSIISDFSHEGLRVLGMAYKEVSKDVSEITHSDIHSLIFLGLQGMLDPPRPDAVEAIREAKKSGVRVLMITGDNSQTALNISKTMGLSYQKDTAITGAELDLLDTASLDKTVKNVSVFARVSPHHKLRIVNSLKNQGEIVTVTGDGVNDAPALKTAHIGVAMGITGSDVAKEASDMVVLDDNFTSIYKAVIEGRVAFDNIRKATYFLLSIGVGMLLAIFITIVAETPLILLPAQILWLNLVTSGLQDVSLAFEPKEPGIESRPPRDPSEGFLNKVLVIRMAIVGIAISVLSLSSFYYLLYAGASLEYARTFALTTMVFSQLFNVFNARSETTSIFKQNPFSNRFLFVSVIASVSAQMIFLYLPGMRTVFRNTSLSVADLLVSFLLSVVVLIVSEIHKYLLRIPRSK